MRFLEFATGKGTGLVAFLKALFNTARCWDDNQLLIAPGVRDRVVNIALRDDEGGLNLDMAPEVIADLDWRGRGRPFDRCTVRSYSEVRSRDRPSQH